LQWIIEVKGLRFGYHGVPVLREVGFSIAPGEFVGIIGSNGAGKSTLLKLILGELAPHGGGVSLFGEPQGTFRDWPKIGYVPQNSAAMASGFPANVAEVVSANLYAQVGPLRPMGKRHREKALQALDAVGMRPFAGRMIGALSGGQLQRVMLARALVSEPRLLLLDEPSTGVDAAAARDLYELLRALSGQGITVVMVTHDLARSVEYLQRALCLEQGTVVELDKAQMHHELRHRHTHP